MKNASAAFLNAVRKSMATIRIAVGATTFDSERLTCAERLQYDGYLRREATGKVILALSRQGMPIKKIAQTTGHPDIPPFRAERCRDSLMMSAFGRLGRVSQGSLIWMSAIGVCQRTATRW